MIEDVIYAKASGGGAAAISVVRLSGAGSHAIVERLCGGSLPAVRMAGLRKLKDPEDGGVIDQALVLLFADGASYTGEESAELHIHGGEAVSYALFGALERLQARLARPGEFSRRALRNGALDLAEAESVGALIAAETEAERRQALRGLDGEVGRLAATWRDALISVAGLLETGVDFVEEELGSDLIDEAATRLQALRSEMKTHIADARRFEMRLDRPMVALLGPPNAGKSSLLNAVAGVDRAIVSSMAGTTRDRVDLFVRVAGREITLSDTAGLRDSPDEIERQGVFRSRQAMAEADLRIFVVSGDTREEFDALKEEIRPTDALFWNKADLSRPGDEEWPSIATEHRFVVSAKAPEEAKSAIERYLHGQMDGEPTPESPIAGSARRIALLEQASERLTASESHITAGAAELASEELRRAMNRLEALTGSIDHEDVLDALFSRFCIGK